MQCNGARSFVIAVGVRDNLECGTVFSKDYDDPNPTVHSTVNLCGSSDCRTTSDVTPALPCFGICVALQWCALDCTKCPSGLCKGC